MIESIFSGASIKKNDQQSSIAAVTIEILPEFGWRMGNNRTFGPGTLFQGYVVVKGNQYSARATRLRLHFKGVESLLTYDVGPGIIRTQTNVLFRVGSTLWQKADEDDSLCPDIKYKFLFTLQMPMVQYPPSIDHHLYRCCYKLSAYLDPSLGYGEVPVTAQSHINYIPLIETRLLKTPLYLDHKRLQTPMFTVKMYSTEYISGDMLRFAVCSTESLPSKPITIHANLYRILTFHDKQVPTVRELINSRFSYINSQELKQERWFSFKINDDLVPTVTFSSILSLTYKLKVKIGKTTCKNKLKKIITWPLSKKSNSSSSNCTFETPITIGTMGLGVRVVDELKLYSSIHIPSPKFIKNLEHEDLLPKYEPARLPRYTDERSGENNITIGRVTPASSVTIIRSSL